MSETSKASSKNMDSTSTDFDSKYEKKLEIIKKFGSIQKRARLVF